jgi:outer membrane protein insertion porin family
MDSRHARLPLDARRGTYTSFQEFLSDRLFGAQASSTASTPRIPAITASTRAASCSPATRATARFAPSARGSSELIPLPERLYAGGPVSLRGFSQNAAGPRDPETGFQIGGAGALINSTELRLPPPTLALVRQHRQLCLFHDMGNVFTNAGDAWASFLRVRQPDSDACRQRWHYSQPT